MRILVVRPDAIGDVVLMLPLIATIHATYPEAEIYTLQQPYTIPLTQYHPHIHAVIPDWRKMGMAKGFLGFMRYVAHIKSYGFSMVFLPYNDIFYTLLVTQARIPFRIGDRNRVTLSPFLTHSIGQSFRNLMWHETEQSARLIWAIRPDVPLQSSMKLVVTPTMIEAADKLMTDFELIPNQFVIIHPSSGGGNRAWLKEKYAQLIDLLVAQGITPVLTGVTPNEIQGLADIRALTTHSPVDLGGKTTLEALMGLIHHAAVVIGTDTGPTHIAAALHTPVVSISPSKFVKPLRWGPWNTHHRIISHAFECQLRCKPGCKKRDCLIPISPQTVLDAIESLSHLSHVPPATIDRREWLKTSVHHLVLVSQESSVQVAGQFHRQLQEWGATVTLATTSYGLRKRLLAHTSLNKRQIAVLPMWNVWAILYFLMTRDIGMIHLQTPQWVLRWVRQLSALGQYAPPVICEHAAGEMPTDRMVGMMYRAFEEGVLTG